MSYLILEISLYLLASALLGVGAGWLFGRRGLKVKLEEERQAKSTLNADWQSRHREALDLAEASKKRIESLESDLDVVRGELQAKTQRAIQLESQIESGNETLEQLDLAVRQGAAQLEKLKAEAKDAADRLLAIQATLSDKDRIVAQFEAGLAERDKQIAKLQADLTARLARDAALQETRAEGRMEGSEGRIPALETALIERTSQVENLTEEIARREGKLANLEREIGGRDARVSSLQEQLAAQVQRTSELEGELAEMRQRAPIQESSLEGQSDKLSAVSRELAERNERLAALASELEQRDSRLAEAERELARRADAATDLEVQLTSKSAHVGAFEEELAARADDLSRCVAERERLRGEVEVLESLLAELDGESSGQTRSGYDNLRNITGIGPKLERILNEMGISHYRQIAAWSDEEIDAIQEKLVGFPGRIRRDRWVEGAKREHKAKYGEDI